VTATLSSFTDNPSYPTPPHRLCGTTPPPPPPTIGDDHHYLPDSPPPTLIWTPSSSLAPPSRSPSLPGNRRSLVFSRKYMDRPMLCWGACLVSVTPAVAGHVFHCADSDSEFESPLPTASSSSDTIHPSTQPTVSPHHCPLMVHRHP
jgi:hypothetical protein